MKSILLLLFTAIALFTSCSDNGSGKTNASASAESHEHSYRCPMNCEKGKTYDKPGKCPVCGMNLEHYDGGEDNGLTYKMIFTSEPAGFAAGQEALLRFTPAIAGSDSESVALDLQHEKKIHLIVVSDDLAYFEHIHPEYNADETYHIKVLGKGKNYSNGAGHNETRFDNGGKYYLFADYKPSGGAHQVEKIQLDVPGKERAAVSFDTEKLSGNSGAYSIALVPTGQLTTGRQSHIAGTIMKDGKVVDPGVLENYLGAKAHMVVISVNEKEYLHVHPDVSGGKFDLNTTFKMPGMYRGWIQFKADGKVHTIDVTLKVAGGNSGQPASDHKTDDKTHNDH